jgi:hypothetical protein
MSRLFAPAALAAELSAVLASATVLAFGAGCATRAPDLYHWGSYEECAGSLCREAGGTNLPDQIRKLSADIEKARAESSRVPPGAHAHLGYLYDLSGNFESAALEFAAEKELYPESAVFMDGLLRRMKK